MRFLCTCNSGPNTWATEPWAAFWYYKHPLQVGKVPLYILKVPLVQRNSNIRKRVVRNKQIIHFVGKQNGDNFEVSPLNQSHISHCSSLPVYPLPHPYPRPMWTLVHRPVRIVYTFNSVIYWKSYITILWGLISEKKKAPPVGSKSIAMISWNSCALVSDMVILNSTRAR